MPAPQHILVLRFSAMGDVAMTVPVIHHLLQQNPQARITVVSNVFLQPLFEGLERCYFYPAFLKQQHKGIGGLFRLYKELRAIGPYDAVADLHNVLRSKILRVFFRSIVSKIGVVDKGRTEKKQLTRKKQKICRQLTPMHERYAAVFRNIGLKLVLNEPGPVYPKKEIPAALKPYFSSGKKVIGVAPFAQYKEKMYPLEKMKVVIQALTVANNTILLFGGGEEEAAMLQQWEMSISFVFNVAGRYSLKDELAIISNLNAMVSMDSANMHLAALFDVPVVSIWGATHPFAGFNGWGQTLSNVVDISLYCRPCSVFGNKPCYRGDHACMNWLNEEKVIEKVKTIT